VAVVQAYILRILEEAGPGMKVRLFMYIAAFPYSVSSSVADPDRDSYFFRLPGSRSSSTVPYEVRYLRIRILL
jgi:hypothetical protein